MTKNERIDLMKLRNRKRRETQLRRNIIISIIITVFIVIAVSLGFGTRAKAESNAFEKYDKCFKSVCVAYDEDLEDIAIENINYNFYKNTTEYVNEVIKINHLENEDVKPGNYIVVPYFNEK